MNGAQTILPATPHLSCSTCIFFAPGTGDGKAVAGNCKRNPPMPFPAQGQHPITGQPVMQLMAFFPPVMPGEWCGEHTSGMEEDDDDGDGELAPSQRSS